MPPLPHESAQHTEELLAFIREQGPSIPTMSKPLLAEATFETTGADPRAP